MELGLERLKSAYIRDIAYYLPEARLTNHMLEQDFSDWSAEKIYSKTRIRERRVAADDETSLDMAEKACKMLIHNCSINIDSIDFLILMTETPDYYLPSSGCILHGRLNLPERCGAFDVNLGCSAYIYGLILAKSLIVSGTAKNILLATADTYTKLIHPLDKSTRTLFGDAATATWISDTGNIEICESSFGTRGKSYRSLIVPAGGMRIPKTKETGKVLVDENGYYRSKENIFMDGTDIMSFSIDVVPRVIDDLLNKTKLSKDDIQQFIFHQANGFMLSYLRKKLGIDKERFVEEFEDVGNTVSSTIPIAMKRRIEANRFPRKGNVVLCGFGVGLSWGGIRLRVTSKTD